MNKKISTNNNSNFSKLRNDFNDKVRKSSLSSAQKLVAHNLCLQTYNDTGKCVIGLNLLQEYTSFSRPTVRKALADLLELGLVSRTRDGGSKDCYAYTLHPDVDLDAVDNRNKHQGNVNNLQPSYSPTPDVVPEGSPTHSEFDDESISVAPKAPKVPKVPKVSDEDREFHQTKANVIEYHRENKTGLRVTDAFVHSYIKGEITLEGLTPHPNDF